MNDTAILCNSWIYCIANHNISQYIIVFRLDIITLNYIIIEMSHVLMYIIKSCFINSYLIIICIVTPWHTMFSVFSILIESISPMFSVQGKGLQGITAALTSRNLWDRGGDLHELRVKGANIGECMFSNKSCMSTYLIKTKTRYLQFQAVHGNKIFLKAKTSLYNNVTILTKPAWGRNVTISSGWTFGTLTCRQQKRLKVKHPLQ